MLKHLQYDEGASNRSKYLYTSDDLMFAFATNPNNNNSVRNILGYWQCKEQLVYELCENICRKRQTTNITWDKIRIITYITNDDKANTIEKEIMRCFLRSKSILNVFEKKADLQESEIYKVVCKREDLVMLLFEGNPIWLRSPQLIFLYVLLVKIGFFLQGPISFKSIPKVERCIKKTLQKYDLNWSTFEDECFCHIDEIAEQIEAVYLFINLILNNIELIFPKKEDPYWYFRTHNYTADGDTKYMGITELCKGNSGFGAVQKVFDTMIKTKSACSSAG